MDEKSKVSVLNAVMQLLSPENSNEAEDDAEFQKAAQKQIKERDEKYTVLLKHFVSLTKVRNIIKECFKWIFLLAVIGCMITLAVVSAVSISKTLSKADSIKQIKDVLPVLVTSLIGFISTVIVIPLTITKYLFSTKEDENITQIILHTQEHDNSGREWAEDFKKLKDEVKNNESPKANNG